MKQILCIQSIQVRKYELHLITLHIDKKVLAECYHNVCTYRLYNNEISFHCHPPNAH